MENATRALLIAAGTLMGVMILSLGVYMYYNLGEYIATTQEEMESNARNKFNAQFYKYVNEGDENNILTIQDVVTVANLAYQNNKQHGVDEANGGKNFYVEVNIYNGNVKQEGIEKCTNNEIIELLEGNNGSEYSCKNSDIKISQYTGRVYEIKFSYST